MIDGEGRGLFPAGQLNLTRPRRVVLGVALIRLHLAVEACNAGAQAGSRTPDGFIEITVPIRLKHRQSATLIIAADQPLAPSMAPDRTLVRAVCVAREWRRRLESGEVATTRELARLEGLCHRHTGRLLPLAYLAPDLVEAIVEGRQPRAMTLQALTATALPRTWDGQRQLVASFA